MAFSWYHSISVKHNQVPSNQSDFPILVNFTDANLATVANGGKVTNSSGFDIGFYSDTNAAIKLSWEMERYTATSGEVVAWIKLPTISSSPPDTVFYIFYGDSTITTDQSNPSNVWSNSYLHVFHLGDGSTLNVSDSLNTDNGQNHGATATIGQIDGGAAFVSSSSQYILIPTEVGPTSITLEAWANATSLPSTYNPPIVRDDSGSPSYAAIYVKSNGKLACKVAATTDVRYDGTGTNTLLTSTWYHLVMTYDSTNGLIGYVNGSVDGTAAANGVLGTTTRESDIGRDGNGGTLFWNGSIDEVRISSIARSADWITATYNNHVGPTSFVSHGGQTPVTQIPAFMYGWS